MNSEQTRRSFFATMALGVSASAFPMMLKEFDQNQSLSEFNTVDTKDAEAFFTKIKGTHRIVYDGSNPHNGLPIIWKWAFYYSNNEMGSDDSDITAMTVLRHAGVAFSFDSATWKKYELGAHFGVDDAKTGKPSLRNSMYEPGDGDMPLPSINGIKQLQERGALFCVCNLAISVQASRIAKKMNIDTETVFNDLIAGVLPGIQIVPTGVWALGRAQANGCGYIYAG